MTGQLATRVMKARRPGECPRCGRYISVGQQIGSCGGLWFCIRCIVGHLEHEHPETQ